MALSIEEQVLRLDVAVRHTLAVQVVHASENLSEAALDLGWGHAAAFDSSVEIAARAELHDFAPMQVFVLYEVNCLHDVDMMQRRGNAELRREFLNVFLLCFILPPLPEFLHELEHGTRGEQNDYAPSRRTISLLNDPTYARAVRPM